jgi:peroxiredoxin
VSEELIFAAYPIFRAVVERTEALDRPTTAKEGQEVIDDFADRVTVRGTYSTAGFSPSADLMFFLVTHSAEDVQDFVTAFRKTRLGRSLDMREMFLGLTRPAEFAKDHLPAFAQGKEPKRYLNVYPFVRTADWYLLDPEERGRYLREHGELGRRFPDVWANTTSAFGLNDYEWILGFEADSPDRLVDLLRTLRATEARRYTKLDTPFFTGIRKDLAAIVADLP